MRPEELPTADEVFDDILAEDHLDRTPTKRSHTLTQISIASFRHRNGALRGITRSNAHNGAPKELRGSEPLVLLQCICRSDYHHSVTHLEHLLNALRRQLWVEREIHAPCTQRSKRNVAR